MSTSSECEKSENNDTYSPAKIKESYSETSVTFCLSKIRQMSEDLNLYEDHGENLKFFLEITPQYIMQCS
jgi:hypothetical protein